MTDVQTIIDHPIEDTNDLDGKLVLINDKVVQLMFWMYTLECSIFRDINKSLRAANEGKDLSLKMYTSAMMKIMKNNSGLTKIESDKLYHAPLMTVKYSLNHHLLAFRGAQMTNVQLDIWKSQYAIREQMILLSLISSSENIQVALQFSQVTSADKKPVLIVLYAENNVGSIAKRIGFSNLSVYQHEKEILFISPAIYILKIEEVLVDDSMKNCCIYD